MQNFTNSAGGDAHVLVNERVIDGDTTYVEDGTISDVELFSFASLPSSSGGVAWVAIRQDILTKFTPAELQQAQADKPHDALLDLIENPWELP